MKGYYSAPVNHNRVITPVVMSRKAYLMMWYLTEFCKAEWSALAPLEIVYDEYGKISYMGVPDLFVPKQECTGSSTEMDEVHQAELMFMAHDMGYPALKTWIHSHDQIETHWSGTDNKNIENICQDILLSIEVNAAGSIISRLDLAKPFRLTSHDLKIIVDWGDLFIGTFDDSNNDSKYMGGLKLSELGLTDAQIGQLVVDEELKAFCKKLVEERVEIPKPKVISYTGYGYKNGYKNWNSSKKFVSGKNTFSSIEEYEAWFTKEFESKDIEALPSIFEEDAQTALTIYDESLYD